MDILKNNKKEGTPSSKTATTTKIAALATIAGIIAVVPLMLGGLIGINMGDVRVLSPDCSQTSQQGQQSLFTKLMGQSSEQSQTCNGAELSL
jgi:hypothetical protein